MWSTSNILHYKFVSCNEVILFCYFYKVYYMFSINYFLMRATELILQAIQNIFNHFEMLVTSTDIFIYHLFKISINYFKLICVYHTLFLNKVKLNNDIKYTKLLTCTNFKTCISIKIVIKNTPKYNTNKIYIDTINKKPS